MRNNLDTVLGLVAIMGFILLIITLAFPGVVFGKVIGG